MRDAMIAGMTLNIFNNHARRVKMANLAQAVNVLQAVILTEGKNMILTPTYHVMEMYKVHQDAKLIPISLQSTDFEFNNEKIPAVSVSASQDKQGHVHISLVNIDPNKKNKVRVDLGAVKAGKVTGRILTSKNLRDYNSFKKPAVITPVIYRDAKIVDGTIEVEIPAFSVLVLELI
jgi:Alpha-L-arabinofuranosidase